ncbi:MAG: type IX secretion system protein PorQ [bacterium]|nr:type IX secretion system protein PorQ [Candidatus Kapabacteria bacterium]
MNRSLVALILTLSATASTALAQETFVYEFLRNDASARAAAMGGTFLTIAGDPVGMFTNPATINTVDSTQVSFSIFKHLLDINSGFAAVGTEVDGIGRVGVGVNFNSYGSFEKVSKDGQAIGEFGATDIALSIGWATELGEGFSAGLAAKGIFASIDDFSSTAIAIDGGLLFQDTTRRVNAALAILNLGSQLSNFNGLQEELPLDLKLGVSHTLRGLPLQIAVNFHRLLDSTGNFLNRFEQFSVGGEFTVSKPIRLRFGYDHATRRDIAFGESKGLAGMSAGFGVLVKGYRFDYAFNSLARLGSLHHISINASF